MRHRGKGRRKELLNNNKRKAYAFITGRNVFCHWRFHLCCWASAGWAGSRPLCYLLIGSSICLCFFHNYNLAFPLASREVRLESHQDGLELRICEYKFCKVTTVFFVTSARLHKIKSLKNTLAKRTKCGLGGVHWVFCETVSSDVE